MLYAIKDSANIRVDTSAGVPVLYANYGKTSLIDFTAESTYAYNKTVKAVRFDGQREGTFKTEFEIFEKKWLALLFGTSITSATRQIAKREVLSVAAGGAGTVLAATPVAGSLSIFITDAEGIEHGIEQTVGNPGTTVNKYSIANNVELTFNATTFNTAGKVIAYYMVSGTKMGFTVNNITFPGGYKIYADAALRGTDQVDVYVQYQLHNAKPKSNVSFGMDADSPAKLSIEWDIMGDANGNMLTYVEV
jgi:hypothetical protein